MKKIVRGVLWSSVVALLGFFLIAEIGVRPQRTVETDFLQPHRAFSSLGPPARVAGFDTGHDTHTPVVRIVGEPVYVDVRVPRLARSATVTMWWGGAGPNPALGVEKDGQIVALKSMEMETPEEGFLRSRTTYDLATVPKTDGAVRFVISLRFFEDGKTVPGVSPTLPFFLHRMRVTTERPPLKEIFARVWKW